MGWVRPAHVVLRDGATASAPVINNIGANGTAYTTGEHLYIEYVAVHAYIRHIVAEAAPSNATNNAHVWTASLKAGGDA